MEEVLMESEARHEMLHLLASALREDISVNMEMKRTPGGLLKAQLIHTAAGGLLAPAAQAATGALAVKNLDGDVCDHKSKQPWCW